NLNAAQAETVLVTFNNSANGDTEVIRLTETGPNTGVFAGYVPTAGSSGPAVSYNGVLSIDAEDHVTARYVDCVDGSDASTESSLVDPYGIVFDSSTGASVSGAIITIRTASGGAATVYGDDGVSIFPSTVTSGATATDSSGRVYTFPAGEYRFPFLMPGSYRYLITPPAGYGAPSTVETSTLQGLPGGPFTIIPGSRGEIFIINAGPAMRIDVPIDPYSSTLWLRKSAGKEFAGHGDFIPYRLTVTNVDPKAAATGVRLHDRLPIGFRLRHGSVRIDGVRTSDPDITADGRALTFSVGTLAAGASATIEYVAEVTVGTRLGQAVNSAWAVTAGIRSNVAKASVTVRDDFLRTHSTLMGRVTTGACNEVSGEGTDGVEGVRLYLEDGTFVISDKRGLFHFEGVRDGLHVVQLDVDSLPEGYEPYACTENTRFAGRAFSQFVEVRGGGLWRTDFHIRPKTEPALVDPDEKKPPKDALAMEITNAVEGKNISYRASIQGGAQPARGARLNVTLPEGVQYRPGSSAMDGVAIDDPELMDKALLVFKLNEVPAGKRREITFSGTLSGGSRSGLLVTQAYLVSDDGAGAAVITPAAETMLQRDNRVERVMMPEIVLRPHFTVRGTELSDADRQELDKLADSLSGVYLEKIEVSGHTQSLPGAQNPRIQEEYNQALSLARARTVGRYLMDKLHIPPEKLSIQGSGSTAPVADN
ncbi:MAG TPA: OmpA family protein, partial [Anaerolineae bacterium]|nr:OmpA family protein [Anaerolineae bacterium]